MAPSISLGHPFQFMNWGYRSSADPGLELLKTAASWFSVSGSVTQENSELLTSTDAATWSAQGGSIAAIGGGEYTYSYTAVTDAHWMFVPVGGMPANGSSLEIVFEAKAGLETSVCLHTQANGQQSGYIVNLNDGTFSTFGSMVEGVSVWTDELTGGWRRVHVVLRVTAGGVRYVMLSARTGNVYLPASAGVAFTFRSPTCKALTASAATSPAGHAWTAGAKATQPQLYDWPGARAIGLGGACAESEIYLSRTTSLVGAFSLSFVATPLRWPLAWGNPTIDCPIWRGTYGSDTITIALRSVSGVVRWVVKTLVSSVAYESVLTARGASYATGAIALTFTGGNVLWYVDGVLVQTSALTVPGGVTSERIGMLGGGGTQTAPTSWSCYTHDFAVFSGTLTQSQAKSIAKTQLANSGVPWGPWEVVYVWGQSNAVSYAADYDALSEVSPLNANASAVVSRNLSPGPVVYGTTVDNATPAHWQTVSAGFPVMADTASGWTRTAFGAEQGIADALPGRKLLLINIGANGCPLRYSGDDYCWAPTHSTYVSQLAFVQSALPRVTGAVTQRALAIIHGETDSANASGYAALLEAFCASWEAAVGYIPIKVISLLSPSQTASNPTAMRPEQITFGTNHQGYYDTTGLVVLGDNVHFTTGSRYRIGLGLGALIAAAIAPLSDGQELLEDSIFWGSTLDATSPDRVATREAVSDFYQVLNATLTQTGTGQDGVSNALRLVPNAGSYADPNMAGRILANAVSGFTEGVRSTVVVKWKPDASIATMGPASRSYIWLNNSVICEAENTQNEGGQQIGMLGANSPVFPYRGDCSKSGDYWQEFFAECAHTNAGLIRFQPFTQGTVVADGVGGITIDEFKWYQSPLATLPNRATGGAVASVASEATAPLLERPLANDQSQHRGAWVDGTRCMRFLGIVTEYVDISGAAAISGTDHDWAITLTWQPTKHPAADADVLVVSGTTARLKLSHLATGYLRITRTADDGTSVTATCSRKVGTLPHTLTVQCVAGSVTFWSQGVQWGTAQALSSSKVATFTSARLGASTWQGAVAECVIAPRGYNSAEIAAQHATLCIRRSLPVGARETWLMNGQSNIVPSTTYTSRGYKLTGQDATRIIKNCRGVHFEGSDGITTYAGWGPARYFNVDRRTSQGVITTTNNYVLGQELTLHANRKGIATIRYGVGGRGVNSFAPGGDYHAAMVAAFDLAVEEAGVPLNIKGCLYVNGEYEIVQSAGNWTTNMTSLHSFLATRYGSGGTFYAIHRRLPTAVYHGAYPAGVAQVQSEMDAWVAAAPTSRAGINMEDMTDDAAHWEDYPTNVHGGTPQRYAEGLRFAAAIAALGL